MRNTNEAQTAEMTTSSELKDMIRGRQREFDQAELHADTGKLQELLTEDFQGIGPKGFVLNKEQWISRHKQFKYQKLDTSDRNIRLYDKMAIVGNNQKNEATFNNEPVKLSVRVVQVWVQQQEKWRLASIQFSPVAENQGGK